MKKNLIVLAVLSLTGLAEVAGAEAMQPGLWKISVEASVAVTPGWRPEPFQMTRCLTESDAQNPDRLLAGMGGQGVTGCDFSNREQIGDRLKFDLSCAGQLGIKGHGEVSYTATSLDGTLDVTFDGGEQVSMQNKLHATYLGQCPSSDRSGSLPPGL